MPELPEVETVRRGLEPVITGAKIISITLNRRDLRFPFPEAFSERLVGRTIMELGRRGKYLLFHLSQNETILSHLGMSGSWRIEDDLLRKTYSAAGKFVKHDHFLMDIQAKDGKVYHLTYNDVRRFGFMLLLDTNRIYEHPLLKKLGLEPLSNEFSGRYLQEAFVNKKISLKGVLLDQSIIAGLGNIYVCEALWRSRLSPQRGAFTLALKTVCAREFADSLAQNIRNVIAEAISFGGSTLRDYIRTDGSLGYFQHSFSVYGREGKECFQCGIPITRISQSGRSSFYCSQCQK
ncbi:bifunctional DNA-formamidopyrimidine glycosylase/DNA-(apurinic or apyrimidinic site) lyase [Bartonella quintana]|uniref:Formamidopyrimidine-DNA glycosylase n=3 Tax=Bartonella quintana TaxID=803 RepID=FPG_BARQU|nr:bifunctional DNA-formamidopyrimidine glycosylase/DNA-(apurinic or apyrimidinic site) lyase [Bartonella quintana]Q6G0L3.3 RecName: Full=Formamidopyrimidine-DNA glycosylase; Short=Fapy-DNA glycosylase; AltName: Full=DNA-(apurinic or apyrimidinic site) lyase MutM; Short=AP lyase MutM [Bartonella quintana str. Toulouse]ETS13438.1 formamidopyrimidine-DNA glycosylase [Bartonella quintana BQ2-D70]ETS13903.1 formamidopyrimidine-DNA glycosylase [Bartonella quintana JK 73rel]ETS15590.1 formamidopyrimi